MEVRHRWQGRYLAEQIPGAEMVQLPGSDVLQRHDQIVRRHFRRFRQSEVNTTGDRFVATFGNPGQALETSQESRYTSPPAWRLRPRFGDYGRVDGGPICACGPSGGVGP